MKRKSVHKGGSGKAEEKNEAAIVPPSKIVIQKHKDRLSSGVDSNEKSLRSPRKRWSTKFGTERARSYSTTAHRLTKTGHTSLPNSPFTSPELTKKINLTETEMLIVGAIRAGYYHTRKYHLDRLEGKKGTRLDDISALVELFGDSEDPRNPGKLRNPGDPGLCAYVKDRTTSILKMREQKPVFLTLMSDLFKTESPQLLDLFFRDTDFKELFMIPRSSEMDYEKLVMYLSVLDDPQLLTLVATPLAMEFEKITSASEYQSFLRPNTLASRFTNVYARLHCGTITTFWEDILKNNTNSKDPNLIENIAKGLDDFDIGESLSSLIGFYYRLLSSHVVRFSLFERLNEIEHEYILVCEEKDALIKELNDKILKLEHDKSVVQRGIDKKPTHSSDRFAENLAAELQNWEHVKKLKARLTTFDEQIVELKNDIEKAKEVAKIQKRNLDGKFNDEKIKILGRLKKIKNMTLSKRLAPDHDHPIDKEVAEKHREMIFYRLNHILYFRIFPHIIMGGNQLTTDQEKKLTEQQRKKLTGQRALRLAIVRILKQAADEKNNPKPSPMILGLRESLKALLQRIANPNKKITFVSFSGKDFVWQEAPKKPVRRSASFSHLSTSGEVKIPTYEAVRLWKKESSSQDGSDLVDGDGAENATDQLSRHPLEDLAL